MNMINNKKRKTENGKAIGSSDTNSPQKKAKKDGSGKVWNKQNSGDGKPGKKRDGVVPGKQEFKKKGDNLKKKLNSSNKKQPNNSRKKQLSGIVSEAKANHQLFTDKKIDKKEKLILINSTYDLVKDNIPELSRIKGMGKVIASLLTDRKNTERVTHVLNCFSSTESKLLLIKSNGYKIAIKLIRIGSPETISQFVAACLSNSKGVRALMSDFKSSRVLCAAYENGNAKEKTLILTKLVLGNMPLSNDKAPLSEVFSKCKTDVVEGCKTFLQSVLLGKSLRFDVIQDTLALCLQTHKATGMDVSEFVTFASEHILTLCRRVTNCTLSLWVIWLANAQTRKHIMKSIKGKVVTLLQTYNGRMFMMALLESTDDTKALEKFVLKEFIDSLEDLVLNVDVRKLLEFLLLPRSTKFMHPKDIEILRLGDDVRTSKKSNDARFGEIKKSLEKPVLSALKNNCESWLKDNKLCLLMIAVVERFGDAFDAALLQKISKTAHSSEFSERISDKAVRMVLESLLTVDVARYEADNEDTVFFINHFVPNLGDKHISNLISKCPRLIFRLVETATKLDAVLTFKSKKSWLWSDAAQKALKEWKHQEELPRANNKKAKGRKAK